MAKLAFVYKEMGEVEKALTLYQQCLAIEELSNDMDIVLSIKESLSGTYHETGKLDMAKQGYQEVLNTRISLYGNSHHNYHYHRYHHYYY